ncbi:hypothetical protein BH18ACT1_BH18ACT1_00480 [soil metagenome]
MPAAEGRANGQGGEEVVAVVKGDCPTCQLVRPVLEELAGAGAVRVVSEDDDAGLETSWRLGVEAVPTLLRLRDGTEVERLEGWWRERWEDFLGRSPLGADLPGFRPGCGARAVDPLLADELAVRFGGSTLRSRRVELAAAEDPFETMVERGWSDGLPVVPPTEGRVLRMLAGTTRGPQDVVAVVPPDLVECNVEKVAVNAVLAGCLPEHLPVVLTAVEAACTDEFNIHGLLATTWFSAPVVVVNGPITRAIGMNSGVNALWQGNRANATIGRALQLVIRNVGGGRPGGVDRATLGHPGKYTFCFAEAEETSPWEALATDRGLAPHTDAVTLFAGSGVQGVVDQLSRTADSLARSLASCLRTVAHPKLPIGFDALLVVSPEHARVFADAGWSRSRLVAELDALLQLDGAELVRGAGGMAEGIPERLAGATVPKFRPGGLLVAHAGGGAGLFSAIIGGWASGEVGSAPVTRRIDR